jgi:hypothetical protein
MIYIFKIKGSANAGLFFVKFILNIDAFVQNLKKIILLISVSLYHNVIIYHVTKLRKQWELLLYW